MKKAGKRSIKSLINYLLPFLFVTFSQIFLKVVFGESRNIRLFFYQVVDNMRAAPEDERFNRLKNLLDRSNVYAKFLLKRMDQQREQEKSRREMKEKAKEKRDKKKEDNQVHLTLLCFVSLSYLPMDSLVEDGFLWCTPFYNVLCLMPLVLLQLGQDRSLL